jgi:hypothetical protein
MNDFKRLSPQKALLFSAIYLLKRFLFSELSAMFLEVLRSAHSIKIEPIDKLLKLDFNPFKFFIMFVP